MQTLSLKIVFLFFFFYRGVLKVDVNLQKIDINQCSSDGWFSGTHRCQHNSSKVRSNNVINCNVLLQYDMQTDCNDMRCDAMLACIIFRMVRYLPENITIATYLVTMEPGGKMPQGKIPPIISCLKPFVLLPSIRIFLPVLGLYIM